MKHQDEAYEDGLEGGEHGVDTRLNQTGEYATYRKWLTEMEQNRTCKGKLCWVRYHLWFFLQRFNPILGGGVVVLVTSGIFYSSLKAGNELDIAFIQSLLTGFVVMIFFLMVGALSDKCSRFREINYPQIVRDETHWSRVGLFIIYVVCLGLSAWALKNINNYCGQDKKPCLLKEAFISH